MRHYHWLAGALVGGLALGASGCGSGLVKVSGKVTLDGQPVEDAVVIFEQEGGRGHPASGQTNSDGVFYLGTFKPGDGAFPGDYKVMILPPHGKPKNPLPPAWPGMTFEEGMARMAKVLEQIRNQPPPFGYDIAPIYRDPNRTPLRQRVPPDGPIVFEVKAEPKAKKPPTPPPGTGVHPDDLTKQRMKKKR